MIIGIIGRSVDPNGRMCSMGTGKDKATEILIKDYKFTKVAMADEIKRFCAKLYGFSTEQLWGPSQERNKPDPRLPREHHSMFIDGKCECCGATHPAEQCYLTPRYAIQQLGNDWGRNCFTDTWVNYTIDIAKQLVYGVDRQRPRYYPLSFNSKDNYMDKAFPQYDQIHGLSDATFIAEPYRVKNVIIPDCRYLNECQAIKKNGGKVVLIHRKVESLPKGPNLDHDSEKDLNRFKIGDDNVPWDCVVENDGTIEELGQKLVDAIK